jgi:YidC/Oxa1 family membrane protein insertase
VDFFVAIGSFIMKPLYFIISAILIGFHNVFGAVFGEKSGASWALSIIGLTIVIRAALIPLFVKQIKSSRNMQLLQPRVKELQKKYGHDRERLTQETMALYKETGTNPFSSCLPLIVQMPIFLALFRLLNAAAHDDVKGLLTKDDVNSLSNAKIFGAHIADSFTTPDAPVSVKVLAAFLVLAMTATTFLTQRQLMSKNMPADALTGPYAQQQKLLLYVLPVVFAVGGIAFPIGVLLYWTTSNLWTMGQQFYVIRNNPAPNTEAFRAKEKRDAEKARRHGHAPEETTPGTGVATDTAPPASAPRREQPKRQSRSQRKAGGAKPNPAAKPKPTTEQGETP